MARVKTYKIDEIIKLLNEYRFENSGAKVTIPKFGEDMLSRITLFAVMMSSEPI